MSRSSLRGAPGPVIGCLSWVGLTGETGLSPRPSEAIGHCPCKLWMNAAGVPVSESGDDCPREILVTSSSGLFVGTPSSNPVAGMARLQNPQRRCYPARHAQLLRRSANSYPSVRIESGHASKIGNRSLTPFPDPWAKTRRWHHGSLGGHSHSDAEESEKSPPPCTSPTDKT
jgi:hypothetical protein